MRLFLWYILLPTSPGRTFENLAPRALPVEDPLRFLLNGTMIQNADALESIVVKAQ